MIYPPSKGVMLLWRKFAGICLLITFCLFGIEVKSQSTANYTFFTHANGSLMHDKDGNPLDMATGTTQAYGPNTGSYTSTLIDLGFRFYFMGVEYTQLSISPDGVVRLGSTAIGGQSPVSPSTQFPYIIPINIDNYVSSIGKVHYKKFSIPSDSVFAVEWSNLVIPTSASGNSSATKSTFQLRIYKNTGIIEFVYGTMFNALASSIIGSVAFSSFNTAGTIGSVVFTNPFTYNSSSTTYSTASFTGNTAMFNLSSANDGLRRVFRFTPPVPNGSAGNMTFTSVSATSAVVNWTDNSTNEAGYKVYRSSDGVNYSLLSSLPANSVSLAQQNLTPGATYYYKVFSVTEGMQGAELIGNVTTLSCTISGLKTIPGNYATLTAALNDLKLNGITGPVILELQPGYNPASETYPLTLASIPCSDSVNTITIMPSAGATINITSTNNGPTFDINDGDYWIIDGRQGGVGATSSMTIKNLGNSSGCTALRLVNDATHNIAKYLNLICGGSSSSSVVQFASGTTGNNSNLIDNCSIDGNAGSSASPTSLVAGMGIYSSGNGSAPNSFNIVSNCNIFNFFNSTTGNFGMNLTSGNSNWTITNNSFYQTANRSSSSFSSITCIQISTLGTNFNISNNFFGGKAPLCGGGTLTASGTNMFFTGLSLNNVGSGLSATINGNRVSNISVSSSSSTSQPFYGMNLQCQNLNVEDNIIGNSTGVGNISVTYSGTASPTSHGIRAVSAGGVSLIRNNIIGSINLNATSSGYNSFNGFEVSGANSTVRDNIIGSESWANNISSSSTGTGSSQNLVQGMNVTLTGFGYIKNNVVANLSNNYNPTSTSNPVIKGINISTTVKIEIDSNTVRDLSTSANGLGINSSSSVIGMYVFINGGSFSYFRGNKIFSLRNANAGGSVSICGVIYDRNSTSPNDIVSHNYIHSLLANSSSAKIFGLNLIRGNSTVFNNMIGIGTDTLGNHLTTACSIIGIYDSLNTNSFYHNTVYIGGLNVGTTSRNSYALYSVSTQSGRAYQNNIFVNERSNASTGGKHYAVKIGGSGFNQAGLTLDNNVYYGSGNGFVLGNYTSNDYFNLNTWKSIGKDIYSLFVDPCLINPLAGFPDLHLGLCANLMSPADGRGVNIPSISTDYDGENRSQLTPTDIGADAGIVAIKQPLGDYPSTTVITGNNIVVIPDTVPLSFVEFNVSTSPTFTGILTADPITGNVYVTNAKPAGTYTVTVVGNNSISKTFQLTVAPPLCTSLNYDTTQTSIPATYVAMAIGDFDNDGKHDYAACSTSPGVGINLGNGQGGFSGSNVVVTGLSPSGIAIGDFNGDSKQDLAIANSGSASVSIRTGSGTGSFSGSLDITVGSSPKAIVVCDLNNDSRPDFVTANSNSGSISVCLGSGLGTFGVATNISIASSMSGIVAGDFNMDGFTDVLSFNNTNVYYSQNNGAGGFANGGTTVLSNVLPRSLATGDFNQDGKLDFACMLNSSTVSIMLGTGTGSFNAAPLVSVSNFSENISITDLNGDNKLDLAITTQTGSLLFKLGNGDGTFSHHSSRSFPGSGIPLVFTADLTADGKQEILVSSNTPKLTLFKSTTNSPSGMVVLSGSTVIADGDTTPSVNDQTDIGISSLCTPRSRNYRIQNPGSKSVTISEIYFTGAAAANFKLINTTMPIVVSPGNLVGFEVMLNPTMLGVQTATMHVINDDCSIADYDIRLQYNGISIALGTFPSITVRSGADTTIMVSSTNAFTLSAKASGNFKGEIMVNSSQIWISNAKPAGVYTITISAGTCASRSFTLTVLNPECSQGDFVGGSSISVPSAASFMHIGDYNRDGKQDILCNGAVDPFMVCRTGDGAGGFTGSNTTLGGLNTSFAVADFDLDGRLDFAYPQYNSNFVYIYGGNSLGTFSQEELSFVNTNTRSIAAADFNNDGNMDIAMANAVTGTIYVRMGEGFGNIINAPDITGVTNAYYIITGDFNSDGNKDLAVAHNPGTTISIFPGNGDGTFGSSTNYSVGSNPTGIVTDDFNSDGKQDLAVSCSSSSNFYVLTGSGTGGFTVQSFGGVQSGSSITTGDFNGDGNQDILITNSPGNIVYLKFGNGTGGFPSGKQISATNPIFAEVGDFNQDGYLDFVTASFTSSSLSVFLGGAADIMIQGNGNTINDGSQVTSTSNNTDFGFIPVNNTSIKTFTIQNTNQTPLSISGITKTGNDPNDFIIGGITFPLTISGGASTTFTVSYTSTAFTTKSAVLHVNSNDCDEADYDFLISASGGYDCSNISDNNLCTDDACDPQTGISHTPVNPDDNNTCTVDGCDPASGIFNNAVDISDNNICTIDACDPINGISHVQVSITDNNACTIDGCDPVNGVYHSPVIIDDNNLCTNDNCDPITGNVTHSTYSIDDQNLCTIDICNAIYGVFHIPVDPNDNSICTFDACDPLTGIYHTPSPEICSNGLDDNCNGQTDENCTVNIHVKMFIEGFYIGGGMMRSTIAFNGTSSTCDNVILELHDNTYPYNTSYIANGILNVNGQVDFIVPSSVIGQVYYIVIRHRNSLQTWSSSPVQFITNNVSYDFTNAIWKAYGSNQADLGDGNFAFYSGDVSDAATATIGNQDGIIESQDYIDIENGINVIVHGYNVLDITGDWIVESDDYVLIENNVSQILFLMRP